MWLSTNNDLFPFQLCSQLWVVLLAVYKLLCARVEGVPFVDQINETCFCHCSTLLRVHQHPPKKFTQRQQQRWSHEETHRDRKMLRHRSSQDVLRDTVAR